MTEPDANDIARCCDDCGVDLVAGEAHAPDCALAEDEAS